MNRPNRNWSAEGKYRVIKPIISMEKSLTQVSRELDISSGMLHRWVEVYKKAVASYRRRNNNITTLKPYILEYYYKLYM